MQADAFFEAYKHIPFDKIYTSTLRRSRESIEKFLQLGIPDEALPGLNEISWGSREGQAITPEEDRYYHRMLKRWREGETHHRIEGGESPEDVVYRQKEAMFHILSHEDENTILICMHGRAMRILLTHLLNYPLKDMDTFEHENLCLYELVFTGTMFMVTNFNDTRHLMALKTSEFH